MSAITEQTHRFVFVEAGNGSHCCWKPRSEPLDPLTYELPWHDPSLPIPHDAAYRDYDAGLSLRQRFEAWHARRSNDPDFIRATDKGRAWLAVSELTDGVPASAADVRGRE